MSDQQRDEKLLIDYVLGRCDAAGQEELARRLDTDPAFAGLHASIANTLGALGACPAPEPPDELVERTMARVRAARRTEALLEAEPLQRPAATPVFSFRELAAVAALLILALGVLIPSLNRARHHAQRFLCGANVGMIHTGLSHYASGNDEALPQTAAKAAWWRRNSVADFASNSAGLFVLVRHHLAEPSVFQCPATDAKPFVAAAGMSDFPSPRSIAYSYQYSLAGPMRRDDPQLVPVAGQIAILADDTPLFAGGRFRRERVEQAVSDNHRGKGMNVLYIDGSVRWVTDARVGVDNDNIYTAGSITDYVGNEAPVSPVDSFLLPHPGR